MKLLAIAAIIVGMWFAFNSGYGGYSNSYNSGGNYYGGNSFAPNYATVSYPMNNYWGGYGNHYYYRPVNNYYGGW
ncbi:MAG TPA: hypothetical protein VJI12_02445 [archaeon]|nr:hypothetical protein [archaeon]